MPFAKKILHADNMTSFRETCAEFLQFYGYQTFFASSPEECLCNVENYSPHLVLLDLRMRDDKNEEDLSGLTTAKLLPSRMPKIIYTAFPTWEAAREALTVSDEGLPPATYFVSKLEGLDALHKYIQRTFENHIRVNWEMTIDWELADQASVIRLIDPTIEETILFQRTDEITELLCRVFLNATHLKLDKVLFHHAGLVALQCLITSTGNLPETVLVICGLPDVARQKIISLQEALSHTNANIFKQSQPELAETLHYTGTCFTLNGVPHNNPTSLEELFNTGRLYTASGLRIDKENQRAWLNGRLLTLTSQEFRLLCFLYDHHNQLCSREHIIERFFDYPRYEKMDASQQDLINTNISRLRIELEPDRQHPQFLKTVRGRGYCLQIPE